MLDCLRPVLDALGLDEQREAGRFLVAFDALLAEAGIADALVIQHMGHLNERARGDSRLRDWPDAEWRLVRRDDHPASARFITRVWPRRRRAGEPPLDYDSLNRHLTLAGGSRAAVKKREALAAIVAALTEAGEPWSGRQIKDHLAGTVPRDAVEGGLAFGVQNQTLAIQVGARKAHLYRVVGS